MTYSRGLDGLRGVAVLVVVLFHGRAPFAGGGFLGVSLFFTLSGFLITSLLLSEFAETNTISLRRFYLRRARRLLPAAYGCLLGVAMLAAWWSAGQRAGLPGDVVASVANVANWRFALASSTYAELFRSAPSPVAHFWSLAIEEQIYLLLPVVVAVALRRGRHYLGVVTCALLSASVAATLLTSDRDLVYHGTHTRASELLIGVALALWLARDGRPLRMHRGRFVDWSPGAVAAATLLALVALASLDQAWIYRGGLPLVGAVSAILIAAVWSGQFPCALLETAPLVALGRVSYGVYLLHWPIFLLLDADRTGLTGISLFVLRCVVTGAVAVASHRWIEEPVRRGNRPRTTQRFVAAIATGVVVVIVAAYLVPSPQFSQTEQLLALGTADMIAFESSTDSANTADMTARAVPASQLASIRVAGLLRVAVIGSEQAAVDAGRAAARRDQRGMDIEIVDDISPNCPLSTTRLADCDTLGERFDAVVASAAVAGRHLDVLVIATGAVEDAEIDPRSAVASSAGELSALAASQIETSSAIRAVIDSAIDAGIDVVLYSAGRRYGPFDEQLVHIAIAEPAMGAIVRTQAELSSLLVRATQVDRASDGDDASSTGLPTRVLIIGDSTSLSLAMALNDGSDGRLQVLWAGANGCPLASVEAARPSAGDPWTQHDCEPYETELGPIAAVFDPDVLLVVSGPTELTEHRFVGDPAGHIAGDPAFTAARNDALRAIAATVDRSVPILIADVPAIRPGGFASSEMAEPARLDALNAQIERWDRRFERVAVFSYRDTLEGAETSPGALRSDGVHPDAKPLEELARAVYVDRLIAMTESLRAQLATP